MSKKHAERKPCYLIAYNAMDRVLHPKKGAPVIECCVAATNRLGEVRLAPKALPDSPMSIWLSIGVSAFWREEDAWRSILRYCRRELGIARQQERRASLILRRLMALHEKSRAKARKA